jgi:hypothetical protein
VPVGSSSLRWQVLLGNRLIGALGIPEDGDYPPPLSVEEELNAVDPANVWFRVRRSTSRFVCAEDVGSGSESIGLALDFSFEETLILRTRLDQLDEIINRIDLRLGE